jgi:small subunit ribosomal protein S8
MTVSDPIADMLTRVRNAVMAHHDSVLIPASRPKIALARILKEESFIRDYEVVRGPTPQKVIRVFLRYYEDRRPAISGLRRVSKPGLRVYVANKEVPRHYGGLGISVVSTPAGMMPGQQAWKQGIGGELMCYVW